MCEDGTGLICKEVLPPPPHPHPILEDLIYVRNCELIGYFSLEQNQKFVLLSWRENGYGYNFLLNWAKPLLLILLLMMMIMMVMLVLAGSSYLFERKISIFLLKLRIFCKTMSLHRKGRCGDICRSSHYRPYFSFKFSNFPPSPLHQEEKKSINTIWYNLTHVDFKANFVRKKLVNIFLIVVGDVLWFSPRQRCYWEDQGSKTVFVKTYVSLFSVF